MTGFFQQIITDAKAICSGNNSNKDVGDYKYFTIDDGEELLGF